MTFKDTRSNLTVKGLTAVLYGTTPSGGLLSIPDFTDLRPDDSIYNSTDYLCTAEKILNLFFPEINDCPALLRKAYSSFSDKRITPLVRLDDNLFILELFKGPTSAFKDLALQLLPHLMLKAKETINDNKDTLILTATSGDTGKASLEGFKNIHGIRIIVFYPADGVSAIQERQMITQEGDNVCVCSVEGNFDDCQSGVKKALNTLSKNSRYSISSANSINIGRLIAQTVYYFHAYAQLIEQNRIKKGDKVNFCVPSGNFGDILAGYWAKMMGLPVNRLICASNMNNVLTDFINTGTYNSDRKFYKTYSPSMDILISSNVERLLYNICGMENTNTYMQKLIKEKKYSVSPEEHNRIKETFSAGFCPEDKVKDTILKYYRNYSYLPDPHTANALYVNEEMKNDNKPTIVLSTASPYKFPSVVISSLNEKVPENEFRQLIKLSEITSTTIPENLKALENKPLRFNNRIKKDDILSFTEKIL